MEEGADGVAVAVSDLVVVVDDEAGVVDEAEGSGSLSDTEGVDGVFKFSSSASSFSVLVSGSSDGGVCNFGFAGGAFSSSCVASFSSALGSLPISSSGCFVSDI